jgi:hypothetical protein
MTTEYKSTTTRIRLVRRKNSNRWTIPCIECLPAEVIRKMEMRGLKTKLDWTGLRQGTIPLRSYIGFSIHKDTGRVLGMEGWRYATAYATTLVSAPTHDVNADPASIALV